MRIGIIDTPLKISIRTLTAYCLLPTAYCLLPTAYSYSYCLLPTAYCLLPTWVAVYGVYYRIYVSIYCIYGAGEIYVPYMGLYIWGRSLGQSVSQSVSHYRYE